MWLQPQANKARLAIACSPANMLVKKLQPMQLHRRRLIALQNKASPNQSGKPSPTSKPRLVEKKRPNRWLNPRSFASQPKHRQLMQYWQHRQHRQHRH